MESGAWLARPTRPAGSFSICNSLDAYPRWVAVTSRRRSFGVQTLTPINSKAKALELALDLYRQIHKLHDKPVPQKAILDFLERPEKWAELQIRHYGWSYYLVEKVVRRVRILRAQFHGGV